MVWKNILIFRIAKKYSAVPKCAIVGGNPIKILGYRDIAMYEKLKKDNKLYLEAKYRGLL